MGHGCEPSIAFLRLGLLRCVGDVYLRHFLAGLDSWVVPGLVAPASVKIRRIIGDEVAEPNDAIKDSTTNKPFDTDEEADSAMEIFTELPLKKRKTHRGKRGGRRRKSICVMDLGLGMFNSSGRWGYEVEGGSCCGAGWFRWRSVKELSVIHEADLQSLSSWHEMQYKHLCFQSFSVWSFHGH